MSNVFMSADVAFIDKKWIDSKFRTSHEQIYYPQFMFILRPSVLPVQDTSSWIIKQGVELDQQQCKVATDGEPTMSKYVKTGT